MDLGLGHLLTRMLESFTTESRFWWPFIFAIGVAIVGNIVWYYAGPKDTVSPDEITIRPWAFWVNLITLFWVLLLAIAKVPFLTILVSFAINIAILVYLYAYWLPPREAFWERERRRQKYIPQAKRKRRRTA